MRRLRLLAALLLALALSASAHAATYYVAANGDDAHAGTSPDAAWRTLAKVQASVASGDTVLLRRGDVFREGMDFTDGKVDGLTFGAYGPDDSPQPVIDGGCPSPAGSPTRTASTLPRSTCRSSTCSSTAS